MYVPAGYNGPQDQGKLATMFVGYIPSDQVDTLAQEIRARQSPFYTALVSPYKDLALHVVASFPISAIATAGQTPDGGSVDSSAGSSSADTAAASSASKTREDAIIGVVTSLGAITLIILAFLAVRAVKQRREIAHRRLSDQSAGDRFVGLRPDNQDFDRDSVGGQRRRSFYYAEDSLRGYETQRNTIYESGMRERRTIVGAPIGAPIMQGNTAGW